MIYKGIVGSRSYGLSNGSSDVDTLIIADAEMCSVVDPQTRCHKIVHTPKTFMLLRTGECGKFSRTADHKDYFGYPNNVQAFFPQKFCVENRLTEWIKENREDMVKARLADVYERHTLVSEWYMWFASTKFCTDEQKARKPLMRAIHQYNTLVNYANGMTFADAFVAQGETREFLLSVRNGKAPLELVLEEHAKARAKAKSVAGYYQEPRADLSVLDEFKYMVNREVELLRQ